MVRIIFDMDELLLTVGFILQVLSVIWIIFYIRDRRVKKRFKEESLGVVELDERVVEKIMSVLETEDIGFLPGTTYRGWRDYDNRNNPMPLRERYGGILEEKEDFIPKKKIKYHTLEEPIEYYSENEAEDELIHLEDEGCGCDTACNCYDTTIYDL